MKEITMKNKKRFTYLMISILVMLSIQTIHAQQIRWLRVSDLQAPISSLGAEYELEFYPGTGGNFNFFSWPSKYNTEQTVTRMKCIFIGCKNFYDPVQKKVKTVKVIGSGPKFSADLNQIFPVEIKLIGKNYHPGVFVDNTRASAISAFDLVDEIDPNLPCDRMVIVKYNTSMGITVTKKVMIFASSKHGNYFINDYVFKNTGIFNPAGDTYNQTMDSVWFYFMFRHAFGGITSETYNSTWGAQSAQWGYSTLNHAFGENPAASDFNDPASPLYQLRGFYSYYGPFGAAPRAY